MMPTRENETSAHNVIPISIGSAGTKIKKIKSDKYSEEYFFLLRGREY
jgi:hypothetical protein